MQEIENSLYMRFASQSLEFSKTTPPKEWYYLIPLNKEEKVCGLILGVHKICHEEICRDFTPMSRSVSSNLTQYNISEAINPTQNNLWGYGKVIKTVQINNDWFEYHIYFSSEAWLISLTLSYIADVLAWNIYTETNAQVQQLALIDGIIMRSGYHGASFSVLISPLVRKWVELMSKKDLNKIRSAMFESFSYLRPNYGANKLQFKMWVDTDRFGLSVPGDCACLGVSGNANSSEGVCYKLEPHNIDNVAQQLALLTGVAQIWYFARNQYLPSTLK